MAAKFRGKTMRKSTTVMLAASFTFLLALSPVPARAAQPTELERVYISYAEGTLQIAPDGSVAQVEVQPEVTGPLRGALANTIGKLHFLPVLEDGKPIRVMTGFHVVMLGRDNNGNLDVTLDSIDFQAPKGQAPASIEDGLTGKSMPPPSFPKEEQRHGHMATVKVAVRITPDGHTGDVSVVDSMLYDHSTSPGDASRALKEFERAAIAGAHRWEYNVPPSAKTAKQLTASVVIDFVYDFKPGEGLYKPGRWLPVQKAPKRAIAWLPDEDSRRIADSGAQGRLGGVGVVQPTQPVGGTPVL
jgi:hypothetical protein